VPALLVIVARQENAAIVVNQAKMELLDRLDLAAQVLLDHKDCQVLPDRKDYQVLLD
jgi:hypothetical protein